MKKRIYVTCILLSIVSPFLFAQNVCIIVHGTWASKESWHQPGGDFFEAVKLSQSARKYDQVISFVWSGKNNDYERFQAGLQLAEMIDGFDSVTLIAHSHGATVGIIASQLLYEQYQFYGAPADYQIKRFYALGVPVNKYDVLPNMNVIEHFYNLFSFEDLIQPVFGVFGRTFAVHDRIANLSVTINGRAPSHSEIHDPLIGKYVLSIHEEVSIIRCPKGTFSFVHPGKVAFHQNSNYCDYRRDYERVEKLAKDERLMRLLLSTLMKNRSTKSVDDAFCPQNQMIHELEQPFNKKS